MPRMIGIGRQEDEAAEPSQAGWGWLLVVLALYLPFMDRPFDLDGGFLMANARAALESPLDPYHGRFDLIGRSWSRRHYTHPPLLWYYLAPVAALPHAAQAFAAHAAFLLFPLLLLPGLRLLGRYAPESRGRAFFLTSPLLAVVSHPIGWELPILALGLLTFGLMVRGAQRARPWVFLSAAAPAAAVSLMAYPPRILPMMLILGVLLGAPGRRVLAAAALSLLPLILFELATERAWGLSHFMMTLTDPQTAFSTSIQRRPRLQNLANMLAVLGAAPMAAPLVFLGLRKWLAVAVSVVAGAVAGVLTPLPGAWAHLQMAVWCTLGTGALLLVGAESLRAARQALHGGWRSQGAPIFWAAWFWMQVGFCGLAVVYGSARYVLPLVAPLAYFVGRAWSRRPPGRGLFAAALAVNVLLALVLSAADLEETRARAEAPRAVAALPPPAGRFFFIGPWAFETAMHDAGYPYLHYTEPLRPGDRIVRPRKLTGELGLMSSRLLDGVEPVLAQVLPFQGRVPLRLNDPDSSAGFWWSGAGLLPFALTRGPAEELEIYEIRPMPVVLDAVRGLKPAAPGAAGLEAARPRLVLERFGGGAPRVAVFLHPPAVLSIELGEGSARLRLGAGIHPDAGPGDGAVVRVGLWPRETSGPGARAAPGAVQVLRLAVAPGRWESGEVSIVVPAGGGRLIFAAEAGPAGDGRHDWLCIRPELDGALSLPVLGAGWASSPASDLWQGGPERGPG